MATQFDALLQLISQTLTKAAPLMLSFADDALLLVLSKMGITLPGMAWLPTLLLSATIIYWSVRVAIFLYAKYQTSLSCL